MLEIVLPHKELPLKQLAGAMLYLKGAQNSNRQNFLIDVAAAVGAYSAPDLAGQQ